jgi:hypothetical protein
LKLEIYPALLKLLESSKGLESLVEYVENHKSGGV